MKKIVSLVLIVTMIASLGCMDAFASNTSTSKLADTIPEKYTDIVAEAIEKSEFTEEEIDTESIFIVENTSPINLKKDIEAVWVWVALPLAGSSDVSYVGFDKDEYIQAITNFVSFNGMVAPSESKIDKMVADNDLPEVSEVTNLWISERVHLFAYKVVCDGTEYLLPYYFTDESTYNIIDDASCVIELGKAYSIDEFVAICEKESELYAAYRAEQSAKDKGELSPSYVDNDGDVVDSVVDKPKDELKDSETSDDKDKTTAKVVANEEISFNMLTNIRLYDVMEISIRNGSTGEGITISSDYIINDILDVTDRMKLKEYSIEDGRNRGGWSYSVMFGLDDNSSIEYTCSTGIDMDGKKYKAVDDSELKSILDKYFNLIKSINSSAWATEEIAVATEFGILNANNSYNYTANIMREEFCDLAVNMIEATGLTLSTDNPQRPLGIRDTDNINVLKLYKAGIILGKEHKKTGIVFAPTDLITREEAATILYRVATYLNISSTESLPYANYSDGSSISDWAGVAVHTMYQLGVMKGISETEFSPKGNYTVEQSIATLVRLYSKFGI